MPQMLQGCKCTAPQACGMFIKWQKATQTVLSTRIGLQTCAAW